MHSLTHSADSAVSDVSDDSGVGWDSLSYMISWREILISFLMYG